MKTIHTYRTYNQHDCTDTGYRLDLRSDGSIRILARSRWQGTRDGETWLTPPGTLAFPAKREGEPDLDALLAGWARDRMECDDMELAGRRIRVGYVVR